MLLVLFFMFYIYYFVEALWRKFRGQAPSHKFWSRCQLWGKLKQQCVIYYEVWWHYTSPHRQSNWISIKCLSPYYRIRTTTTTSTRINELPGSPTHACARKYTKPTHSGPVEPTHALAKQHNTRKDVARFQNSKLVFSIPCLRSPSRRPTPIGIHQLQWGTYYYYCRWIHYSLECYSRSCPRRVDDWLSVGWRRITRRRRPMSSTLKRNDIS